MLTRGAKIAYDLYSSPYVVSLNECEFVFSSENHKQKFIENYQDNRTKIETSLSNRFKFSVVVNLISDIQLYYEIEKRGFLIRYKGVEFTCLDSIQLDGNKTILKLLQRQ